VSPRKRKEGMERNKRRKRGSEGGREAERHGQKKVGGWEA